MNHQLSTLALDVNKCIGCGMCLDVCPHAVFRMENHQALIQSSRHCMECGACMRNCPTQAIQVDTGVGCAAALISSALNKTQPQCSCSSDKSDSCCG